MGTMVDKLLAVDSVMLEEWLMKQILLVTDGCSNVGVSPVVAAAQAYAAGITVNVVGIVDQGDLVNSARRKSRKSPRPAAV